MKRIFRQKDNNFITILEEMREGRLSARSFQLLKDRVGAEFDCSDGIIPTNLLSHRKDVNTTNSKELAKLFGARAIHCARDEGQGQYIDMVKHSCPAHDAIELRIGAQVALIKNLSVKEGLCNGARGVVIGLAGATKYPKVKFTNGKTF